MAALSDELRNSLSPETIHAMSERLGTDDETTSRAVSAVVPLMLGSLDQNAHRSEAELQSLNRALERDHPGTLLEQLSGFLGGGQQGGLGDLFGSLLGQPAQSRSVDGNGILEHLFGQRRHAVEEGVGRATGLGSGSVGQLMQMLAPIVMGALGRVKRRDGLNEHQIADLVERERQEVEEAAPGMGKGRLFELLDTNNDGKINLSDDIAKVGMALGAALLFGRGRRR
jgi:hypothetical protein